MSATSPARVRSAGARGASSAAGLRFERRNPIAPTAKLSPAAATVVQSAFLSAGQRCTNARRLIVQDGDDRLVEAVLAANPELIATSGDSRLVNTLAPVVASPARSATAASLHQRPAAHHPARTSAMPRASSGEHRGYLVAIQHGGPLLGGFLRGAIPQGSPISGATGSGRHGGGAAPFIVRLLRKRRNYPENACSD